MEPPPELDRGPKFLREAFNALRSFAIRSRPLRSETCEVHETEAGTQILPDPAGILDGSGSSNLHPFQVLLRVKPETDDEYQAAVWDGTLFKGPGLSWWTITGLTTDLADIAWSDVSVDDYVFLETTFDLTTGLPAANAIKYGDNFDPTLNPWQVNSIAEEEDTSPEANRRQTIARKPLARIESVDGVVVPRQYVFTHLAFRITMLGDLPGAYFAPW